MSSLDNAIEQFPIESWLEKFTRVRTAGRVIYADCPFCQAKKRLGVYRQARIGKPLAVCGRCKDGGHGSGVWSGATTIPNLVMLLEGCSFREAVVLIHKLACVQEDPWTPDKDQAVPQLPNALIPLSACSETQPAVQLLANRHVPHLVHTSFYATEDPYRARVLLPCNYQGNYTGFEAKGSVPSMSPKSLFAPNMDNSLVYTALGNLPDEREFVITESVLDAETFHTLPFNAIGCYGSFKQTQVQAILELNPTRLYWFLDGDAWAKIYPAAQYFFPFCENYVPPMPKDQDPNSLGPEVCLELIDMAEPVRNSMDWLDLSVRFRP